MKLSSVAVHPATFLLLIVYQKAAATVKTSVKVALVGNAVTFDCECRPFNGVNWYYRPTMRSDAAPIVDIQAFSSRIKLHNASTEECWLTVSDIRQTDAGIYECVNTSTNTTIAIVSLAVLFENPSCRTNLSSTGVDESGYASVVCNFTYFGLSIPATSCVNSKVGDNACSMCNDHVDNSSIYRKIFVIDRRFHGSVFICSVMFELDGEIHFNRTWTSETVDVHYGPDKPVINATGGETRLLKHGDALECTAESNPPASLQWMSLYNMQPGPEYVVDTCKFMTNENRLGGNSGQTSNLTVELTCVAHGIHRSATSTIRVDILIDWRRAKVCSHFDHIGGSPAINYYWYVFVVVGIAILIVILGVAMAAMRYARKSYNVSRTYYESMESMWDRIGSRSVADTVSGDYRPMDIATISISNGIENVVAEVHAQDVTVSAERLIDQNRLLDDNNNNNNSHDLATAAMRPSSSQSNQTYDHSGADALPNVSCPGDSSQQTENNVEAASETVAGAATAAAVAVYAELAVSNRVSVSGPTSSAASAAAAQRHRDMMAAAVYADIDHTVKSIASRRGREKPFNMM